MVDQTIPGFRVDGHTPGPWSYTDESHLTPREPYWIGSEHPEVGRCTFAAVRSGCDEADELGDMEANARLIAAAPELLEALKACLPWVCAYEQEHGHNGALDAHALAGAAIAKAVPPTLEGCHD